MLANTADKVADRLIDGWIGDPPPKIVEAAVLIRHQAQQIRANEESLIQMRDWYKARGKTLHAHVLSKFLLKLRRSGK